ncbi:hypothetical protein SLS60_010364 [Paraconiothyrium brasiliense]|uniref:RING-type domain-containing protein n=1 Tax=Paraconiothyrium brasiliense TaxID=300254 RepID=A0ABR3QRH2_9PLEO
MPPQNSNTRTKHRPALLGRRSLIDPKHKAYNRVIRLEGQIATIIQIHRFLWRYKVCIKEYILIEADQAFRETFPLGCLEDFPHICNHYQSIPSWDDEAMLLERGKRQRQWQIDDFLDAGRLVYFDLIEELIEKFLNRGVDLAYEGHDLDSFVAMVTKDYLRSIPKDEREQEGLWAKIWWFQHLQEILQDESLSLSEAFVRGWMWFTYPEQWPTKSSGRSEYADMWKQLGAVRQQRFLEDFAIDQERLQAWMWSLSTQEFCCMNVEMEEGKGLKREFTAAGVEFGSVFSEPHLEEGALKDGSMCSICGEGYSLENRGTEKSHIPIRVRPCGHVFGRHCLDAQIKDRPIDAKCKICRARLCVCITAEDHVDACDRILRWLQPPVQLQHTAGPDSYLRRLMLVFEPADEIRKRLEYWTPHVSNIVADLNKLGDLGGGRGLGLCMAEGLVEAGGKVHCLDRLEQPDPAFGESAERMKREYGGELVYHQVDVTDDVSLEKVVANIAAERQRLDGLIAGTQAIGTPNLAEIMHKYKIEGSICLIASMSGTIANRGFIAPVYNSSKAAVVQLAKNLAMEWGRKNPDGSGGIRVNSLSPGHIMTPMVEENFREGEADRGEWENNNMLGRLSTPEEYKAAGLFLLSRASSYMVRKIVDRRRKTLTAYRPGPT